MSEQQNCPNVELVGLGVQSTTPITAPKERVWAAMVDKMYHVEKYLPVTNVKIFEKVPGRHIWREMLFNGNPLNENIYFDEFHFEIRAVLNDEEIHVNIYHPDSALLEYWQENGKGERIPWNAPKAIVLKAMEKVKETAEANP